jgi:hypothetical protein
VREVANLLSRVSGSAGSNPALPARFCHDASDSPEEVITETQVAWAAGLFDGEGSASTYLPQQRLTRRRQMQVSQGGVAGEFPLVLVRFRDALGGVGGITGPYRGYLYYWKTTRNDVIDDVSQALWPFLSRDKRVQLGKAALEVGRAVPVLTRGAPSLELERAWAAGLFDGEGSVFLMKDPRWPDWRGVAMELAQATIGDVPESLSRFHSIVAVGRISGPRTLRNPWSRLPQYRWRVSGRRNVGAVIRALWPWLSPVKREQIRAMRTHLDPDPDLSPGS